MQTRSQQYSKKVFEQITGLDLAEDKQKEYGSLCHNFPVMVMRSGLSQAVAFVWVKSSDDEKSPQAQFLKNLSEITGKTNESPKAFQERINTLLLADYQRMTRIILNASIWYKRFAESLLGVKTGDNSEENEK